MPVNPRTAVDADADAELSSSPPLASRLELLQSAEKEFRTAMQLAREEQLGVFEVLAAAELCEVLESCGRRGEGQSLLQRTAAQLIATPGELELLLQQRTRGWAMC